MDDISAGDQEITLSAYLETPKFVQASANATRLTSKLKTAVQNKQLYETQQILSTVYYRFNNHKEKLEALIDLLYYGAIFLLQHGEFTSGQEVASLFLETSAKRLQGRIDDCNSAEIIALSRSSLAYHKENQTLDLDICQKVSSIAILLPDSELGQAKFIADTLRLLIPRILNRDLLHNVIACKYWRAKDYASARYHFLHCASIENSEDIGRLLFEFHTQSGNKKEIDLFISQFILQFLCLQSPLDSPALPGQTNRSQQSSIGSSNLTVSRKSRNTIKSVAQKTFLSYAEKQKSAASWDWRSLPLCNFVNFILEILDSFKPTASAFKALCETYAPALNRDPNYQSYLNRIGTLYFGVVDQAKQQQQQGGFLNNILMSLMDGTDDEDEDTATPEPSRDASSNRFIASCDELD